MQLADAVAVVADRIWAAKQGLTALDICWEDGPSAKVSTADVEQGLAKASENTGVTARKDGDPASALATAAKKVDAIYESSFLAYATMEPMNCTVHVRRDECDVWTGSQVLSRARAAAAKVTGLPLENVVVHNQFLGGGFGRRLAVDSVTQAVQHDIYRPYYYDRIAAGLDAKGTPMVWTHRIVGHGDRRASRRVRESVLAGDRAAARLDARRDDRERIGDAMMPDDSARTALAALKARPAGSAAPASTAG